MNSEVRTAIYKGSLFISSRVMDSAVLMNIGPYEKRPLWIASLTCFLEVVYHNMDKGRFRLLIHTYLKPSWLQTTFASSMPQ